MNAQTTPKTRCPAGLRQGGDPGPGRAAEQGTGMGLKGQAGPAAGGGRRSRIRAATRPTRSGASSPASCWPQSAPVDHEPIAYRTWGNDIDTGPMSKCGPPARCRRGRGRAHARRPHRLRPAHRRRPGLRERRDSVRRRRRHRLPDEALGARPAGRDARNRIQSLQEALLRRHAFRRRRRASAGPIACRDGPRLERLAHHARDERTRPGSSSARAARATISSNSAC